MEPISQNVIDGSTYAARLKNTPIVFILGMPRSGTTLLQMSFDSHPNISAPPESKFILLLYPKFRHIKKWKPSDIIDFVDTLYIDPLFKVAWNINKEALLKNLMPLCEFADYSMLCKAVCCYIKKDKGDPLLICFKTPLYTIFIPKLTRLFPESKFIHLIREPKDNLYSFYVNFGAHKPYFHSHQWVFYNKYIERHKRQNPDKYYTIRYEDMVKNMETSMQSMCKFMGVTFSPAMSMIKLDPTKFDDYNSKILKLHKGLFKPVNTDNIEKWKTGLPPFAASVNQRITGNYAEHKYGYTPTHNLQSLPGLLTFRLVFSQWFFYFWYIFTKTRYSSYRLNLSYAWLKTVLSIRTRAEWNIF